MKPESDKRKLFVFTLVGAGIGCLLLTVLMVLLLFVTGFILFVIALVCFLFFGISCLWAVQSVIKTSTKS